MAARTIFSNEGQAVHDDEATPARLHEAPHIETEESAVMHALARRIGRAWRSSRAIFACSCWPRGGDVCHPSAQGGAGAEIPAQASRVRVSIPAASRSRTLSQSIAWRDRALLDPCYRSKYIRQAGGGLRSRIGVWGFLGIVAVSGLASAGFATIAKQAQQPVSGGSSAFTPSTGTAPPPENGASGKKSTRFVSLSDVSAVRAVTEPDYFTPPGASTGRGADGSISGKHHRSGILPAWVSTGETPDGQTPDGQTPDAQTGNHSAKPGSPTQLCHSACPGRAHWNQEQTGQMCMREAQAARHTTIHEMHRASPFDSNRTCAVVRT